MIICQCNVVSDRDVDAAIDRGAHDVCALASVCGVAAECGGCLPAVRRLLAERGCPPEAGVTVRTVRRRLGIERSRTPATV